MTVHQDGRVVVTVPKRASMRAAREFAAEQEEWIRRAQAKQARKKLIPLGVSVDDYHSYRDQALEVVHERLVHFNQAYGFSFGTVRVKRQKTRWGSCSANGNLNFNFKLLFLPEPVRDYVIVHELCHLSQLNHSPRFWNLVAQCVPDYREQRAQLRRYALQ